MSIIFGLYHVPYLDVPKYIKNAQLLGITKFDTAQLYNNEKICLMSCKTSDYITTKIYSCNNAQQVEKLIKKSRNRFGDRKINSMLLHRPMPLECWNKLAEYDFDKIGICNYDIDSLKILLDHCKKNNVRLPDVHQMEVHPFIECDELINFCHENNIAIQGHTILTQTKFLNYSLLKKISRKYSVSPACILASWSTSKNINICVSSSNIDHLRELINGTLLKLENDDIKEMNNWHKLFSHRFYPNNKFNNLQSFDKAHIDDLVNKIKNDMNNKYPSNICNIVPMAGELYRSLGKKIATKLYPDENPQTALNKYRNLIKNLRQKRIENAKQNKQNKKGLSVCNIRRTKGPYSDSITNPQPMPVDVTNPNEFKPFFEFLQSTNTLPDHDVIFVRGAMFPDGRMDLCKQVVGPSSIGELCKVVEQSKIIKHFLLGNNVALQNDEENGAQAFANVMKNNNNKIKTWYLAGNCIGEKGIKIIADALKNNTQCKALWLKRNPIGNIGAKHLNEMLKINNNLVLLDLHNCALGNDGLTNLLFEPEKIKTLKHLYLDANGIENIDSLIKWIESGCNVVSLYLSINRIGKEIVKLANALKNNKTIKRLCLASCHVDNDGVKALVDMALSCPKLKCLNLGCYKSSSDMGEHPGNFFNDDSFDDLCRLFDSNSLEYLNIIKCKLSIKKFMMFPKSHISFDTGNALSRNVYDKNKLRFLKHPKRVQHIDSIYRGKM